MKQKRSFLTVRRRNKRKILLNDSIVEEEKEAVQIVEHPQIVEHTQLVEHTQMVEDTMKKSRGRPKKSQVSSSVTTQLTQQTQEEKRPRGRPKKVEPALVFDNKVLPRVLRKRNIKN